MRLLAYYLARGVQKSNSAKRRRWTLVKVVGAKGFEPSTSWSRNRVAKILKALSGVAYETKRADLPLSVVAKLYLELLNFWGEPIISWRERLLSKRENS